MEKYQHNSRKSLTGNRIRLL